jgi:hypothetical protein
MKAESARDTKKASCSLVFTLALGKDQAILAGNNPLHLKQGDKFAIASGNKMYFCAVNSLVSTNGTDTENRTIQLSKSLGQADVPGRYWKISEARYRVKIAFGVPRSRLAVIGTLLTILGAGLTAYRSYHSAGANQNNDHLITWGLFFLTALGAILVWAKEVV